MPRLKQYILLLAFGILLIFSCRKDEFIDNPGAKLTFSLDTVIFDTVFTTIGSSTHRLKVYNPHKQKIKISSIDLARGKSSNFRMNVDGLPGTSFQDIELNGNDSMYIFVEVTVDPNNKANPLIITDSIRFYTNGNLQDVDLVAWGQDAYFYAPPPGSFFFALTDQQNVTISLPNDKPNVIYGYLAVDSSQVLEIKEGTRMHFHSFSGMVVLKDASLKVKGTRDNPVRFEGDRLEPAFEDQPGQWGLPALGGRPVGGIWLSAGSVDNEVNYAIIKNGYVGIHADTVFNANPTLRISNTVIENMAVAGILGQGAHIEGSNCVIANCGNSCLNLRFGGEYNFLHTTLGNFWSHSARETSSLILNNWFEGPNKSIIKRDLKKAYFGNCIIYGNKEDEVELDKKEGADFNFTFDHCLLKTTLNTSGSANYTDIVINKDPKFTEGMFSDFALDTLSPAKDKGDVNIANMVPEDIEGKSRLSDTKPDLGAYERVE